MTTKSGEKTRSEENPAIGIVGAIVVALFLALGGFSGIEKLYQRHNSHEKLTVVRYHGEWSFGEYRECISINSKTEDQQPQLDCTGFSLSGADKVFKVAFSGDLTYDDEKPETSVHRWLCRRNDGDPSFSCSTKDIPKPEAQKPSSQDQAPAVTPQRELADPEIENLRKRNECEQRFWDKKIYEVNGMSIVAACKQNPDGIP